MSRQVENGAEVSSYKLAAEAHATLGLGTLNKLRKAGVASELIRSALNDTVRGLKTVELYLAAREWAYGDGATQEVKPSMRRVIKLLANQGDMLVDRYMSIVETKT